MTINHEHLATERKWPEDYSVGEMIVAKWAVETIAQTAQGYSQNAQYVLDNWPDVEPLFSGTK